MFQYPIGLKLRNRVVRDRHFVDVSQCLIPPAEQRVAESRQQTCARQTSQLSDLQDTKLLKQRLNVRRQTQRLNWQ
jgi:hypothetical protein